MPHPFDRYAQFTEIEKLKEASEKPLRKSLRVNELKSTVDTFQAWAADKGWILTPIPWCREGFFVDRSSLFELRPASRGGVEALGKDLMHLLGHTYMQEAASMLPVALLDPQPGDIVLDMSAAPGSKTTQMASRMQGSGVIIANDVQEKRIWTLKSSLQRSGVTNILVTKKVGQWFAKNMTERFDRVLCDAPCTAQGTSRKDTDALMYSSMDNVGKMAKLQRELLESAVHAAKVGGRIVYSTCTLSPEENEEVISSILNKFSTQVRALSVDEKLMSSLSIGIEDSKRVQQAQGIASSFPAVRLWPQTYDTEGFFCAVLEKIAPTRDRLRIDSIRFVEDRMPNMRQSALGAVLKEQYGTTFLLPGDVLFSRGEQLLLTNEETADFRLPVLDYSLGLPFALRLDDTRIRLQHEIATLRGNHATQNVSVLDDERLNALLDGKDTTCEQALYGDVILRYRHLAAGVGLAKEGKLKNRLPRWLVQKS